MVDDGENAIIPLALGQSCDQIYSYLSEGWHIIGHCDFIEWDASLVCKVLVLLAYCAPLNILLDLSPSSWPVEPFKNLSHCLVTFWMPCQSIVVGVHDLPL